jgi:hypothetical protein
MSLPCSAIPSTLLLRSYSCCGRRLVTGGGPFDRVTMWYHETRHSGAVPAVADGPTLLSHFSPSADPLAPPPAEITDKYYVFKTAGDWRRDIPALVLTDSHGFFYVLAPPDFG